MRRRVSAGKAIFDRMGFNTRVDLTNNGHAHFVIDTGKSRYRLPLVCSPANEDEAMKIFQRHCRRLADQIAQGNMVPLPAR